MKEAPVTSVFLTPRNSKHEAHPDLSSISLQRPTEPGTPTVWTTELSWHQTGPASRATRHPPDHPLTFDSALDWNQEQSTSPTGLLAP